MITLNFLDAVLFLKSVKSFMEEFQTHCGQFYEMREKNSPKVGRENNYLFLN